MIGYWDDLRHMTREDVTAFYRAYYKPNNAEAVVVGDAKIEQAQAVAEKYCGALKAGDVPSRR